MPAILRLTVLAATVAAAPAAFGADYSCEGLVPAGQRLICSGFEPNWAIEFTCDGASMSASFIDAFSGADIQTTPGTVAFSSHDPWTFETSHPVKGSIAATPGGCTDESDAVRDFTFTPTSAPGLSGPFFPFCCRVP
ncbi:hypothetical protein ABUE31_02620 [Mesorhizobium sp. ZMM04-5]|uniref:Secreted protein n=1 Tax=Mesorhizobium marinum TaxID=3228790 RepID=A0ABV3QUZ6_9HYPH